MISNDPELEKATNEAVILLDKLRRVPICHFGYRSIESLISMPSYYDPLSSLQMYLKELNAMVKRLKLSDLEKAMYEIEL